MRHFHVVIKFEVRSKLETLSHGDVSPSLEQHHTHRTTGKSVTDDKFGNDIETDLLVGDGLDDTDRDDVDEGNELVESRVIVSIVCGTAFQTYWRTQRYIPTPR